MKKHHISFIEAFSLGKIADKYNIEFEDYIKNLAGFRYYFNNDISKIYFLNKIYSEEEKNINRQNFEKTYKTNIDNYFKSFLANQIIKENRNELPNQLLEKNIFKRKSIPNYYEASVINLYYIYNAGIHKIIRFKRKKNKNVSLIVKLPSSRLHEVNLSLEDFQKRKLFIKYKEAEEFLLSNWIFENTIPFYKKNYIYSLKRRQEFIKVVQTKF